MSVLQSVLTVLLSLLGSSVVSAYVTHKLSASEKERALKREKLEKIYVHGVDYRNFMLVSITMTAAYHSGKLAKTFISEHLEKNNDKNRDAVNNLTMLCNIYFPDLVPFLDEIYKVRDTIGKEGFNSAAHGDAPEKSKGARVLKEFDKVYITFADFNAEVFKAGQKINAK